MFASLFNDKLFFTTSIFYDIAFDEPKLNFHDRKFSFFPTAAQALSACQMSTVEDERQRNISWHHVLSSFERRSFLWQHMNDNEVSGSYEATLPIHRQPKNKEQEKNLSVLIN